MPLLEPALACLALAADSLGAKVGHAGRGRAELALHVAVQAGGDRANDGAHDCTPCTRARAAR